MRGRELNRDPTAAIPDFLPLHQIAFLRREEKTSHKPIFSKVLGVGKVRRGMSMYCYEVCRMVYIYRKLGSYVYLSNNTAVFSLLGRCILRCDDNVTDRNMTSLHFFSGGGCDGKVNGRDCEKLVA